jgi:aminoglycoside phosphotransferase family enzyme/predicted kinase
MTSLPPHIAGLLSPEAYPHKVDRVELVQTHISYVFLAGDFVYKVKKPVDLGFLDFTTLDKRRHFCQEEVRLNRRLCPGIYLDVVPVAYVEGNVAVDAAGTVVDYAVKMKRLPEERMMGHLLEKDAVTPEMVRALARRLAEFHASAETGPDIEAFGSLETIAGNWRENFEQTEPYVGRTITVRQFQETRQYVEGFLEREKDLFEARVRGGRVRDCHGDLRVEAVCFQDGICIFDCIEFNQRFRYSDVAADLAFLAMDLDSRGRPAMSDELVGLYLEMSGDSTLPLVLGFYKCYRAYVRGKVEGFLLDAPEVPATQKTAARGRARAFLRLAHSYARRRTPCTLVNMAGLSGTGKSFLANALAARLGAVVVSSDVVRKRLVGVEPTERHIEPWQRGIYAPELTERTYEAMLEEAEPHLERGRPVILDATFMLRRHRQAARALARRRKARYLAVECVAEESVARERLARRPEDPWTASDGRWEIFAVQRERFEPLTEVPKRELLRVDTARPLGEQLDIIAYSLIRRSEGH